MEQFTSARGKGKKEEKKEKEKKKKKEKRKGKRKKERKKKGKRKKELLTSKSSHLVLTASVSLSRSSASALNPLASFLKPRTSLSASSRAISALLSAASSFLSALACLAAASSSVSATLSVLKRDTRLATLTETSGAPCEGDRACAISGGWERGGSGLIWAGAGNAVEGDLALRREDGEAIWMGEARCASCPSCWPCLVGEEIGVLILLRVGEGLWTAALSLLLLSALSALPFSDGGDGGSGSVDIVFCFGCRMSM